MLLSAGSKNVSIASTINQMIDAGKLRAGKVTILAFGLNASGT